MYVCINFYFSTVCFRGWIACSDWSYSCDLTGLCLGVSCWSLSPQDRHLGGRYGWKVEKNETKPYPRSISCGPWDYIPVCSHWLEFDSQGCYGVWGTLWLSKYTHLAYRSETQQKGLGRVGLLWPRPVLNPGDMWTVATVWTYKANSRQVSLERVTFRPSLES